MGIGSVSGIIFINDKLGFLGAIRPSGNEGELYRTDDGEYLSKGRISAA